MSTIRNTKPYQGTNWEDYERIKNMKNKKLILLMAIFVSLTVLTGCGQRQNQTTNQPTDQNNLDAVQVAKDWLANNTSTYKFDGTNLRLVDSQKIDDCDKCWKFNFAFESSHGGYGNRSKKITTQVITPHNVLIEIRTGVVTSVITDDKYNEMTQKTLEEEKAAQAAINANINVNVGAVNSDVNTNLNQESGIKN